MIFYEAKVNIGNHPLLNALVEVALIMVITEMSYRWIENPMRHYHYGQLTGDVVRYLQQPRAHRFVNTFGVVAAVLFGLTAVGFVQQPAAAKPTALQKTITARQAATKKQNAAAVKKQKALAAAASKKKHDKAVAFSKLSAADKKLSKHYFLTPEEVLSSKQTPLTAIGDSVLLDDSGDLQDVFPGAIVNGKVGRQAADMKDIITVMAQQGQLAKNVLINIGTNGYVTPEQADDIVHAIGPDHQIFWVTAHVPTREWQNSVNNRIHKTADKYHNVHVIDWYTAAKNQPKWFVSDHVHPNDYGNRYYTSLIAKAVAKENK